ncbi:hypothetical protein HOG21_07160 [bacterium]|nr:hypothetical protein [bacterium]
MKESLHFLSILKCSNSIIVDVDENNDENPIIKSKVENEYLKNIDKETLISMIESFDYS